MPNQSIVVDCEINFTSVKNISFLLKRFSFAHFSIAPLSLLLNFWFFRNLYRNALLNPNLKMLLIFHGLFASLLNFHGILLSIFYLIIDPCQSILSIFDCKLISMPRIVSLSMISLLLVAISIERSYATYKFSKYSADVSIKFYIIALIFGSFAAVSGFQVYSLFSLKSDRENYTLCIGSVFSSSSVIFYSCIGSIVVACFCAITVTVNKIWNQHKLKNYQWFNQGRFDLRSRLQLSQNIDTNQSIFCMSLVFLLTFVSVIGCLLVWMLFMDKTDMLNNVNILFYGVFGQQIYCILYIVAFVLGSEKMRNDMHKKLLKNVTVQEKLTKFRKLWIRLKRVRKIQPKPLIFMSDRGNKYFTELNQMWN